MSEPYIDEVDEVECPNCGVVMKPVTISVMIGEDEAAWEERCSNCDIIISED